MSKFLDIINKIKVYDILNESLNTFTYNLPENRSKRLFDFYTFSSLSPLVKGIESSKIDIRKKLGEGDQPDSYKTYASRKLNTNFVNSFWNSHDKCYVELAKEMMDDIFYCISAEFRHIDQDYNYTNLSKIPEDLNVELYKKYLDPNLNNELKHPKKGEEYNDSYNYRYDKVINSIIQTNSTKLDFVKLCSYIYDNFKFHSDFAGPKWADAANSFLEIYEALPEQYRPSSINEPLNKKSIDSENTENLDSTESSSDISKDESAEETGSSDVYTLTDKQRLKLFIVLDHTWGLSHNTGPTFNKLKSFKSLSSDGSAKWLQKALDKRTQDENLFRFINKTDEKLSDVSQQMVPIIKRVIYSYYGATNEDELYEHVNKTQPVKMVPVHVSDVIYRNFKNNINQIIPSSVFEILDTKFKSHYNHWCSIEVKLKPLDSQNPIYLILQFKDYSVEGALSDEKNYTFDREGLYIDDEYLNSKVFIKNTSELLTAASNLVNDLIYKYNKNDGVKINVSKTNFIKRLNDDSKKELDSLNLGEESTLLKVIEYCDSLLDNIHTLTFKVKDNELHIINDTTSIGFIGVEKQKEEVDQTYSSQPDSEDYFAGKRKKVFKSEKVNPTVKIYFTANPTIGKTFDFIDENRRNIYNFINNCVSDLNIDENGVETTSLKSLKNAVVKQFHLSPIKEYTANITATNTIQVPNKYKKLFNKKIIDSSYTETKSGSDDHDYVLKIKADLSRMTNPYLIDITLGGNSILTKTFRYKKYSDISENLNKIMDELFDNIIESEKENINKILNSEEKQPESNVTSSSKTTDYSYTPLETIDYAYASVLNHKLGDIKNPTFKKNFIIDVLYTFMSRIFSHQEVLNDIIFNNVVDSKNYLNVLFFPNNNENVFLGLRIKKNLDYYILEYEIITQLSDGNFDDKKIVAVSSNNNLNDLVSELEERLEYVDWNIVKPFTDLIQKPKEEKQPEISQEPVKPKVPRPAKSPELLALLNNISLKSKADIFTSGLSKFMMPYLNTILGIIKPYGDNLTYKLYSDYNKTPQGTENISLVFPFEYQSKNKKEKINLRIFFAYNKDKSDNNKVQLYDDPKDVKDDPNAFNDFKDYLSETINGKKPLKDSIDLAALLKSYLLKG
jgi:hypothetical protein